MTDALDQAGTSPENNNPPQPGRSSGGTSALALLREQMERLYALRTLILPSLGVADTGQPYSITLPADPNAPLDQFAARLEGTGPVIPAGLAVMLGLPAETGSAAEQALAAVAAGIHMPYWGLLWASGQALAEAVLADRPSFYGRRVLELGCGLGLTSAAALVAGADLWAVDCFVEALLFTRFNGLCAAGRVPETRLLDWRTSLGQAACRAIGPFDIVLAADVLYEAEDQEPLLELLPTVLVPGGIVCLAEPGRRVSRGFLEVAASHGWRDSELVYTRSWPPDGEVVRVVVHRLTSA
jgi:predicted nicotinamide N-methyase